MEYPEAMALVASKLARVCTDTLEEYDQTVVQLMDAIEAIVEEAVDRALTAQEDRDLR